MKIKKNHNFFIVIFLGNIFFSSCIKENPIEPHTAGEINLVQVEMGNNYDNQVFYSLKENKIVSQNLETDWDIAFESRTNEWHVILNSSLSGSAYNTNIMDFSAVTSINGNENWTYDEPNGNLDSTAIGNFTSGNVYIINRGTSVSQGGSALGYKKIIISKNINNYEIRCAELDGTQDTTIIINKDTNHTFLAFSFNNSSIMEIHPEKQSWDLLFTAYTEVFEDFTPPLPYRVSGVILNRENTLVALDTINKFSLIDFDLALQYNYSSNIDEIGYDWKSYSFSSNTYSVNSDITYIVKTNDGIYFKIKFIDFYNDNGDKGSPKFELQQL